MSISFPTSLDSFTNPASGDSQATVNHATQHDNANDAIAALEAKVGVDSSAVATSLDYKVKSTSSVDPGHKHTKLTNTDGVTILQAHGSSTSATNIGMGTTTPQTWALIDLTATDRGLLVPRLATGDITTAQGIKGTPPAGLILYNTTLGTFQTYNTALGSFSGFLTNALRSYTITGGAPTLTPDVGGFAQINVQMFANGTLAAPTNAVNGQKVVFKFAQDSTGSRTITLNSVFKFGTDVTGVTLSTAASAVDYMCAIFDAGGFTGSADCWRVVAFSKGYVGYSF